MRQTKTHWVDRARQSGQRTAQGVYIVQRTLCGRTYILHTNPNAKRKVTCATCRRILQLPPLTT